MRTLLPPFCTRKAASPAFPGLKQWQLAKTLFNGLEEFIEVERLTQEGDLAFLCLAFGQTSTCTHHNRREAFQSFHGMKLIIKFNAIHAWELVIEQREVRFNTSHRP